MWEEEKEKEEENLILFGDQPFLLFLLLWNRFRILFTNWLSIPICRMNFGILLTKGTILCDIVCNYGEGAIFLMELYCFAFNDIYEFYVNVMRNYELI